MKIKLKVKPKKPKRFYDYEKDGFTQGLLGLWMECRKKAKYFLDGWSPKGTPLAIINGTIGHGVLQEAYEAYRTKKIKDQPSRQQVSKFLKTVEKIWRGENPRPSKGMFDDLELSLLYAEVLLPIYFDYWKKDFKKMEWLKVESSFKIPITLPDGRRTFARGKMDGAFKRKGLWLFESKFKSVINEGDIIDTLSLDIQVMLYLWALSKIYGKTPAGVLYNVVRRPGLRRGKKESLPQFAKRIEKDILSRPEWYFYRFEVSIDGEDLAEWEKEFFGMLKEFLDWCDGKGRTYKNSNSCITKYGRCWGLTPCAENSYHNLSQRRVVFRELEDI